MIIQKIDQRTLFRTSLELFDLRYLVPFVLHREIRTSNKEDDICLVFRKFQVARFTSIPNATEEKTSLSYVSLTLLTHFPHATKARRKCAS